MERNLINLAKFLLMILVVISLNIWKFTTMEDPLHWITSFIGFFSIGLAFGGWMSK